MVTAYLTATEFRNVTNLQSAEYSDTQLNQLILAATVEIDKRTGRTWQGAQTVTNEYYDGDGTDELQLNQVDISSLDALSIDENYDNDYVSVTTSKVITYADAGVLIIDSGRFTDVEVPVFTKGYKTVKVSYKWGNTTPDDLVKNLCALIVMQELRPEAQLSETIQKRISLLRANSIKII
jgi:hypothetical protein